MRFLVLLLITTGAWANEQPPNNNNPSNPSNSAASAESVSVAGAAAVAKAGSATSSSTSAVGDVGVDSDINVVSKGGDGGNISGNDFSSETDASNSGISYHNEYPRQAPGVALVVPNSTTECVVGFGGGGSNRTGSILGGFGYISKDCKAAKLFETFAGLGLHEAAARVFCARKAHYKPFGGVSECEAMIHQSLLDRVTEEQRIIHIRADHTRACESRPKIGGPAVIREIQDDGTILVYECEELAKGS